MRTPKITIGIPVYNGANYLPELLRAIQKQTLQDYRIVITDNASTDTTMEIVREAAAGDERIGYHQNARNIGGNRNFEKVFTYCDTPYFVWLAHDDLIEPAFLETCLEGLENNADVVLSGCSTHYIDTKGALLPIDPETNCYKIPYFDTQLPVELAHPGESHDPVERFKDFFPSYFRSHVHGLIRSDAMRKTGMLGPHMNGAAIFLAELALRGRFKTSEKHLFLRRYHPNCSEAMPWDKRVQHTNPDALPFHEAFLHNTRKFIAGILRTETLTLAQKAWLIGIVVAHTARSSGERAVQHVVERTKARTRLVRAG